VGVGSTAELIAAILRQATEADDAEGLIGLTCDGLLGLDIPLWRFSVGLRTINATVRARSFVWRRDRGFAADALPHVTDDDDLAAFHRSPIHHVQSRGLACTRWRLVEGEGCEALPLLAELRAEGGTDYVMHLVRFGGGTAQAIPGVALAFATDWPGGFGEDELAALAGIVPALGLASFRFALARTLSETLEVYLGPRTAQRVLGGEVRRGLGRAMAAAILWADLRGFTAVARSHEGPRVVAWLDEHLEAIGAPVAAHGGEVLKFLGDGLLAVFPVEEPEAGESDVCRRALAAAEEALAATAEINAARRASGEPELWLDVVLHHGEVVYGNVGAARRLDFTVIGRAVNEASRMEALCGEFGQHLLLSAPFAARCGRATVGLGSFHLRGIPEQVEIFAIGEARS